MKQLALKMIGESEMAKWKMSVEILRNLWTAVIHNTCVTKFLHCQLLTNIYIWHVAFILSVCPQHFSMKKTIIISHHNAQKSVVLSNCKINDMSLLYLPLIKPMWYPGTSWFGSCLLGWSWIQINAFVVQYSTRMLTGQRLMPTPIG